ncbi:hypothetical protein KTH89_02525 [Lachnospiraceae bacterium ASD5720]|uniref:Uncharacterized protein n=1 Tax=Diplocloster agilis TaxID=2850323 RepID=A0A949NFN8_9FIRM|nr:hypothetical protein [Diplocloster agilis]
MRIDPAKQTSERKRYPADPAAVHRRRSGSLTADICFTIIPSRSSGCGSSFRLYHYSEILSFNG